MTPKDLIASKFSYRYAGRYSTHIYNYVEAISSGWQHDAASNMLSPSLAHEPKIQNTGPDFSLSTNSPLICFSNIGPEHLKQLTDYVVFLEQ